MKFIIQILIFQFAPSKQITNNIFYPLYSQPRNWPPHNILMEKFAFNISLYQGPISIGCYMPICRYRHIGADMPRFLFLLPRCRCRVADAEWNFPPFYFYWKESAVFSRHIGADIQVGPDLPVRSRHRAELGIESRNTLPTQKGPTTNRPCRFQKWFLFIIISSYKKVMILLKLKNFLLILFRFSSSFCVGICVVVSGYYFF